MGRAAVGTDGGRLVTRASKTPTQRGTVCWTAVFATMVIRLIAVSSLVAISASPIAFWLRQQLHRLSEMNSENGLTR